jgi:hypothetical protein
MTTLENTLKGTRVHPAYEICRNVIAREWNDRSKLISDYINKITTTPERRLVMTN